MNQESSPSLKKKINIKSHKIIRLNTVEKQSDLEDKSLFLFKRTSSKARINSMKTIYPKSGNEKIRKYTEVEEELTLPECPSKCSSSKQYQTKLKLSAESWVIHDMKTNQYKRGWKPNKPSQFNGLFRILVLLCYCEIIKQNQKTKKIKVKINPQHLKQSRIKFSKKDENNLKWIALGKKKPKTLAKGSIVYFIDIVKSMIISGNQDLFEYCVIYCGYLIAHLKTSSSNCFASQTVNLTQQKQQEIYANEFCQYCNSFLFPSLSLQSSRTQNLQISYELVSTPNQICKLFNKGFFDFSFFRETISLQSHCFYIKYQVGYNYWEDRLMSVKSQNPQLKNEYFCYLVYKGSKNYEAFSYNCVFDILMVIEDSKFSMAELDIQVLEKWYSNVTKPIGSERNKSTILSPSRQKKSLFPILAITKG